MYWAAYYGDIDTVKCIVEDFKVDPNDKDNIGYTPLHEASFSGHLNVVKYFIDYGVNPAIKNEDGKTPLHLASYNGKLEIVKYLIEICKVDSNIKDKDGKTPLNLAMDKKHFNIINYFNDKYQFEN